MSIFSNDTPKTTAKDFFVYLGMIATLYVSVGSFIALWFQIIDSWVADPLAYSDPYSTGISLAIASLLVLFPVFIALSWMIHKDEKKNEGKREIGIRKWLIYLTLFIGGIVIISDLITLLYQFLSGQELTTAFLAKVLVVFLVIGAAFWYYLYKVQNVISDRVARYLTIGVVLVVLASIVLGFVVMGSPQTQREKRYDQERISDLQNIQWRVVDYWRNREALPEELSVLNSAISGYEVPRDPKTQEQYAYRVISERTFELCATFALPASEIDPRLERPVAPSAEKTGEGYWDHEAGRACFERTIDPEEYPPYESGRQNLID